MLRISVITLFPHFFDILQNFSKVKKAQDLQLLELETLELREYTLDKHKKVDHYAYGGVKGMILQVAPIYNALKQFDHKPNVLKILMDANGSEVTQEEIISWTTYSQLVFICGHYDGIDARVEKFVDQKVKIGNFITCGGETPSMVLIDAVARCLPNVVKINSFQTDNFYKNQSSFPLFTKPRTFKSFTVPEELIGGDHEKVFQWQKKEQIKVIKKTLEKKTLEIEELKHQLSFYENQVSFYRRIDLKDSDATILSLTFQTSLHELIQEIKQTYDYQYAFLDIKGKIKNFALKSVNNKKFKTQKKEIIKCQGFLVNSQNKFKFVLACQENNGNLLSGELVDGIFLNETQIILKLIK